MNILKKILKFDFTPTIFFYILFLVLTGLLVYVDVEPIGPGGSHVGLGTINAAVFEYIGTNVIWYRVTQFFGNLAICYVVGFAIFGLVQWVNRQKLRRVDKDLFALLALYVLMAFFYVFFNLIVINFRPVMITSSAGLEASYPSSHTMLVICICCSSILQFHDRMKKGWKRYVAEILTAALMVIVVLGRLLAGVHWLTDIIGAILLSAALVSFYYALVNRLKKYAVPAGKRIKKMKKDKSEKKELFQKTKKDDAETDSSGEERTKKSKKDKSGEEKKKKEKKSSKDDFWENEDKKAKEKTLEEVDSSEKEKSSDQIREEAKKKREARKQRKKNQ